MTKTISIHALVKRATKLIDSFGSLDIISIHALVKRATDTSSQLLLLETDFNPRPREEGDRPDKSEGIQLDNFNPRPREEGDHKTPT